MCIGAWGVGDESVNMNRWVWGGVWVCGCVGGCVGVSINVHMIVCVSLCVCVFVSVWGDAMLIHIVCKTPKTAAVKTLTLSPWVV